MGNSVTTLYVTVIRKDGTKEKFDCSSFKDEADAYELLLTSGETRSFRKSDIKSCVCTGFKPFFAGEQ